MPWWVWGVLASMVGTVVALCLVMVNAVKSENDDD